MSAALRKGDVALPLDLVHRVRDHGLEARQVARQRGRAEEGHLGPGCLRGVGHLGIVGRDHDPVDAGRPAGGVDGVRQQGLVAQPLDVEVGHAVAAAPRRDHGQHAQTVSHRVPGIMRLP
jgi:hypothetical protein